VTTHVEHCESCSARLGALGSLHRSIGVAAEESARAVDFDALFGKIERGIAQGQQEAEPRGKLLQFGAGKPGRVARVARAAGLLVAAGAVIAFGLRTGKPANESTEIEQVAFNDDYGGTVFEVALADGVSTKVVWINDYYDDEADAEEAIQ
jgi:hypothetical protein